MSHTTTFTGLIINNIRAVEKAIDLLNVDLDHRSMKPLQVKTQTVPKLYYNDQFQNLYGKGKVCDVVLSHEASRYDLGLYWNESTNQYDLVYDKFGGGIQKVFGYSQEELRQINNLYPESKVDDTTAELGRFIQAHNVGLTMCMVEDQGYSVANVNYENFQYELELANSI